MRIATGTTRIFNGQLIDGTGTAPVRDAVVVVDDGRITYAGPAVGAPALDDDVEQIDANGGTIMPGLIESHFHATYYNVSAPRGSRHQVPAGDGGPADHVQFPDGARVWLHVGAVCGLFVQHRRVARRGDRHRHGSRSALRSGRSRDLWRRGCDGLEPRLPQDRYGGRHHRCRRCRLGPQRGPPSREGRCPMAEDVPDG